PGDTALGNARHIGDTFWHRFVALESSSPGESVRGPSWRLQGPSAVAPAADDPSRDQGRPASEHELARGRAVRLVEDGPARHRLPPRRARSADRVPPRGERIRVLALRLRPAVSPRGRPGPLLDRRRRSGAAAPRRDAACPEPALLLRAPRAPHAAGRAAASRD